MSGRLGRSLGLDLLGGRICSMDCVYCEVGATRDLTLKRDIYVPAEDILNELASWKAENDQAPDMVTLGGLGEPCLNADLGRIIQGAKTLFPGIPVAVLTNSTMLTDEVIREELAQADVVLPSIDSLVEAEFREVNRPVDGVSAADVAEALIKFSNNFDGKIFLEILLVRGMNDSDENRALLKQFVSRLQPDRVDVVTLTRPGTLRDAKAIDADVLELWQRELAAGTTATAKRAKTGTQAMDSAQLEEAIASSLARRPQTVLQLAQALGASPDAVQDVIDRLRERGDVDVRLEDNEAFYHGTGHKFC